MQNNIFYKSNQYTDTVQITSKLSATILRISTLLLSLIGFTACPDFGAMYGTPTGSFEVKGLVTNEEGIPVPNAKVKVTSITPHSHTSSISCMGFTNQYGNYAIFDSSLPVDSLKILCSTEDYEYIPASITLPIKYEFNQDHQKKKWYYGHATLIVDFKLKKNQEE